jgi:hypothetical protein
LLRLRPRPDEPALVGEDTPENTDLSLIAEEATETLLPLVTGPRFSVQLL